MDPIVLASMLFTVILVTMIGGFILLFPITRRLGAILEQRLNDRSRTEIAPEQIKQLQAAVRSLRAELDQVAERQQFTESLLAQQQTSQLANPSNPAPNSIPADNEV